MVRLTRRAALTALGAGSAVALGGYLLRGLVATPTFRVRLINDDGDDGMMGGGMMGVSPADMRTYMEMFSRHNEIRRVVEEIPGGVRTTTESDSPDLVEKLQAHVGSMYGHVEQGAEIMCMSSSLPTLFQNANGYRRRLTMTSKGVIAEEIADDPALVHAIREHAREVTGFVEEGMPAMMEQMMGPGMMGPEMMGPR